MGAKEEKGERETVYVCLVIVTDVSHVYGYIWPILKTWTGLMVSCLPMLRVNLWLCYASQFCFIVLYIQ